MNLSQSSSISIVVLCITLFLCGLCGCEKSPEPQFRLNAVEKLSAELLTLDEGETFSEEHIRQMGSILTALFGTPNQPKFPFLLGEEDPSHKFISPDNLERAAGPVPRRPKKETRRVDCIANIARTATGYRGMEPDPQPASSILIRVIFDWQGSNTNQRHSANVRPTTI